MQGACRLAWGIIYNKRRASGICLVSSLFLTRVGVYLGVCVCIRTHTHWATRMNLIVIATRERVAKYARK